MANDTISLTLNPSSMEDYRTFIQSKQRKARQFGFEWTCDNRKVFGWQKLVIEWAVRRGRAALFEDCGLGKSSQQLLWADAIFRKTGGNVVIHCPVNVRLQTKREAEKFGVKTPVNVVNTQDEVKPGISLVNYEKLHHFDASTWTGVVLDESSILKGFTGVTKRLLIELYSETPYRLACTATPAPNDHLELGNHADFLGIMPSNEMISRWFINDTMKAGGYRLRRHGAEDFWKWVASWAVCIERPSDIGFDDRGYVLPELREIVHIVEPEEREAPHGQLFCTDEITATSCHDEKRHSTPLRAEKVAELVANEPGEPWLIWCDTNYEDEALREAIPDAVVVRGSDQEDRKANVLLAFSEGKIKRLITKPTIAGHGLNWQHCARVAFVGLSFSYEEYYQAVRRTWRFGQQRPVNVHIVSTPQEESIRKTVMEKQAAHAGMKRSMADAMREFSKSEIRQELVREKYVPKLGIKLPAWMEAANG